MMSKGKERQSGRFVSTRDGQSRSFVPTVNADAGLRKRRGILLIIVLVTLVLITLGAYSFTSLMLVEEEAARLGIRQIQSKYLADSGVDYSRLFLVNDLATIREKGGLWDNPASFQAVPVGIDPDDPEQVWRFTVVSPSIDLA
jgi:hypothetical protein